ncbi:DUF4357 domain-containing protein [Collinsella aerofaciens]|uniref:DUF4357 domain-containing protein n=1 Tax=Collinsella aerofaciens TaxID=74426 RepID=UPI0039824DE8
MTIRTSAGTRWTSSRRRPSTTCVPTARTRLTTRRRPSPTSTRTRKRPSSACTRGSSSGCQLWGTTSTGSTRVPPAVFHTKKNGIRGAGRYDKATGHFTVLAGSKVNLSRPVLKNAAVAAARREIFGDSGGIAELARDLEFPTPSAAAVFVLGGSQNGWTEWVSDDGETLNQVYRSEEN